MNDSLVFPGDQFVVHLPLHGLNQGIQCSFVSSSVKAKQIHWWKKWTSIHHMHLLSTTMGGNPVSLRDLAPCPESPNCDTLDQMVDQVDTVPCASVENMYHQESATDDIYTDNGSNPAASHLPNDSGPSMANDSVYITCATCTSRSTLAFVSGAKTTIMDERLSIVNPVKYCIL